MSSEISNKRDLLINVAKLYYVQGLSQDMISKQIHVSRPTVSRLLKTAIDTGIVRIHIDDISSQGLEMAERIEQRYGIKKAIVTPSNSNLEDCKQNIGSAAALYLESVIQSESLLGIAWGSTLAYVAKNVHHSAQKKVDVIQILGGVGNKTRSADANAIALSLAGSLNGNSYLLQAPFMVKSKVLRDLLMDEPDIVEHFEKMKEVDLALVGLGSSSPELSAQFKSGHITSDDAFRLRREGAVGDICGRHINKDGNMFHSNLTERMITISPDDLKKIPTVIGVACGREKTDVIIGALRGKYIDVLITDKNAAMAVLEDQPRL